MGGGVSLSAAPISVARSGCQSASPLRQTRRLSIDRLRGQQFAQFVDRNRAFALSALCIEPCFLACGRVGQEYSSVLLMLLTASPASRGGYLWLSAINVVT